MKYAILNCWTDYNKGDLGIMISTIDEIRRQDTQAEIIGVSCFSKNDEYFFTCHNILKKYVNDLYPAIFGILVMKIGNFISKHILVKIISSLFETVRMILAIILPKSIALKVLYSFEKETLSAIKSCNLSIAKGGSVFTDDGSYRGKFALYRMCMFYFLLNKYKCPYYILGQSFGPVHGKICSWLVNKVIEKSEKVYLRERICSEKYKNIIFPKDKTGFSNDTAFLLVKQKPVFDCVNDLNFNIGFTVRPVNKDTDLYINTILETIVYFVDTYNAYIHIFKQVSGDNEPDDAMVHSIYAKLLDNYKKNVILYTDNLTPSQLKYLYGRMKIFIGTRLHSTIFAMGAGIPSICLVYHGTKAQGIYENMGVGELVITDVNSKNIIEKSEYILANYSVLKNKLESNVNKAVQETVISISEIILNTKEIKVNK